MENSVLGKTGNGKCYTYKLRAECFYDITEFFNRVRHLIENSSIVATPSFSILSVIGSEENPDVTVIFKSSFSQLEIKDILKHIEDAHVMLETVELIANYTGNRFNSKRLHRSPLNRMMEKMKNNFALWAQKWAY